MKKDSYKFFSAEALLENIETATVFAEEYLEDHDVPLKVIFNFNVVIDELLSNVCNYSGAKNMWLGIRIADNSISMRFENDGDPFDPNDAPEPDIVAELEDRNIGGLGIFMVKKMMDSLEYEYKDGRNIITVSKSFQK
jgi:sigma-B regulation protein RsbU (phosphoserine phosphatase)